MPIGDVWRNSWADSWNGHWAQAQAPATTAALSGTILGATEADIVAGGKTIILTLQNDTWVAAGAAFDAQRQAILDGLSSTSGIFAATELVTAVVRTSDDVVTITLTADPAYDIAATDTVTDTIPASALTTSLLDVIASPSFDISVVIPPAPVTRPSGGRIRRERQERPQRETRPQREARDRREREDEERQQRELLALLGFPEPDAKRDAGAPAALPDPLPAPGSAIFDRFVAELRQAPELGQRQEIAKRVSNEERRRRAVNAAIISVIILND